MLTLFPHEKIYLKPYEKMENEQPEGEKLKNALKGAGFQINAIAEKMDMTRQNLGHHFRKSQVDAVFRKKLFSIFPDVFTNVKSNDALNTPRLEAEPQHLAADPHDYNYDGSKYEELPDGTLRMRIPVVPYKAFAGYLSGFQDPEYYEDMDHISIEVQKKHGGFYLAFEVRGDSMTTLEPELFRKSIFDGVKVVGRYLPKHHWQSKLHTHNYEAWIIVHKTEGILIKNIIRHDIKAGIITIHSLNPDKEKYPDEDLYLEDIEQIFNVVRKVDE